MIAIRHSKRNLTILRLTRSTKIVWRLRRPVQPARVCSYTDFMKCQPLNFKGTEGVVGLSQWLKKMEICITLAFVPLHHQVKFWYCTNARLASAAICQKWGCYNETAVTPPPPRHRGARISVKPQTPMAASTRAFLDAFAAGSPPF
ncbi:hypothetical protein Tco_0451016 [Tanacetum coccineum]